MKKLLPALLAAVCSCALSVSMATAAPAQESAESPGQNSAAEMVEAIQIGTPKELAAFAQSVLDGSAGGYAGQTVVLTADIDCTGIEWQPIGSMDLTDQSNMACMFQGVFDGQGHKISNVTFSSDYPVCGIGIIGMNLGEVKNLVAENINITCTDTYSMAIGAVVGYNMGIVHDVTLTGTNEIAGVNAIGGIAGGSTGSVWNCTVDGTTIRVLGDNDFSSGRIIQCDIAECGGLIIGGSFGGTMDNCQAKGTVIAEGNEPVGMGGIAGCLEMMDSVTNCTADVEIISQKGGHAIGGLCGFSGTHSIGDVALATEGIVTTQYPGIIENCNVTVKMDVPGATHVGGLVGTGLYYYGEETAFKISNCQVEGEILGAVTPGAIAGRAENSVIENCTANVTLDGEALEAEVGTTSTMYESSDQFEAEDPAATAAQLLEDLTGTYEELFPVMTDPKYDQLWLDNCTAILGEETAPMFAEMLKTSCTGTIYGQEAIDAYSDGSVNPQFDCYFINGVSKFVFDGSTISGLDKDGNQVFSHEYEFVSEASISGMLDGYLYMTKEADAGEFTYFLILPDTPATTYHIEFRYGSDADALTLYNEGAYAYWLAAGILEDRDEQMETDVINLFALENMDYSAHMEEALAQLEDLGFIGTWVCDTDALAKAYGDEFKGIDLEFTLDENGHGITTMNGMVTADFEAFAADTGTKGDGEGLYVAYSNLESSANSAAYTMLPNENGDMVLTLFSDEGVISYIKAAA